jgi:hypothetical protein
LISKKNLCQGIFAWQRTCVAFFVSKSDIQKICNYMLKQPEHHKIHTFDVEYQEFIKIHQQTLKPETTA